MDIVCSQRELTHIEKEALMNEALFFDHMVEEGETTVWTGDGWLSRTDKADTFSYKPARYIPADAPRKKSGAIDVEGYLLEEFLA